MRKKYFGEFLGTLCFCSSGEWWSCRCSSSKTKSHNSADCDYYGWGLLPSLLLYSVATLGPAPSEPRPNYRSSFERWFAWASVLPYILAQFAGAMVGQFLVFLAVRLSLSSLKKLVNVLGIQHSPISKIPSNLISETWTCSCADYLRLILYNVSRHWNFCSWNIVELVSLVEQQAMHWPLLVT